MSDTKKHPRITFRNTKHWDIAQAAEQQGMSQGELIRNAIEIYAMMNGLELGQLPVPEF